MSNSGRPSTSSARRAAAVELCADHCWRMACRSFRSCAIRRSGAASTPRVADVTDPARLRGALQDATRVVCCAHARHAAAVIDAAPAEARLIFLGSTRKFTHWPDRHGNGVLAGEAAFTASGRSGVMLHPTMIYGAQGEDNVQRLAALLRRLPIVPLPDGGRALVQPIHQDDVTRAIRVAFESENERSGCSRRISQSATGASADALAVFSQPPIPPCGNLRKQRPAAVRPTPTPPSKLEQPFSTSTLFLNHDVAVHRRVGQPLHRLARTGQRISSQSIFLALPSPRISRGSCDDR